MPKVIGYIRVSTFAQNVDRQLEGVKADKVLTDRVSGKSTDRPQLIELLSYIRDGDILVVHSLDRLACNLDDLRNVVRTLTTKDVKV